MRIRLLAGGVAFTSLLVLASIAAAGPCEEQISQIVGGIDFPPIGLVDSADVIVVFTPHIDIVTIAPVDRVVPGDLERVEKGAAPATIVYTKDGFGAFPQAGVRAKFFLTAFSDGHAHYIIGKLPPEILPPSVAINVSATNYGGDSARRIRIGSSALIEAVVTPRPGFGEFRIVDVYAGFIRPNGTSVWVSGTPLAPTLVESATPVPFLAGVPGKATAIGATYRFADSDPRGWYTVFGAVVYAGADPHNPCAWIDTSASSLLVTDPVALFEP
jgi:hypothetical protein